MSQADLHTLQQRGVLRRGEELPDFGDECFRVLVGIATEGRQILLASEYDRGDDTRNRRRVSSHGLIARD
jgi:hypothetical protein